MNAIRFYRVGNWAYKHKIPLIPYICKIFTFILFNSVIPSTSTIGKGSKLAYGGIGVVIHSKSIIGEKVLIGQNTTIGRALDPQGIPTIGNNVYIGAGARILGSVVVGNNVIIGANSVVTKNIEDNSIVAGVPAKLIRTVDVDIYDLLKNIY